MQNHFSAGKYGTLKKIKLNYKESLILSKYNHLMAYVLWRQCSKMLNWEKN